MTNPILTLDLETTGLNPRKDQIHGVGLRYPNGKTEYIRIDQPHDDYALRTVLACNAVDKLGHNVTFDVKFLRAKGFEVRGRLWDTRKLAHILDENQPMGLDDLVTKYFGSGFLGQYGELQRVMQQAGAAHVGVLASLDLASPERPYSKIIGEYCLEDVKNTWELWQAMTKELRQKAEAMKRVFPGNKTLLDCFVEEDTPFLSALVDIEMPGLVVDMAAVEARQLQISSDRYVVERELKFDYSKEIERVEQRLTDAKLEKHLAGLKSEAGKERCRRERHRFEVKFDWRKSRHVASLLFDELKVPTKTLRRTKTGTSLDEANVLDAKKHCPKGHPAAAFFDRYLKYKGLEKLLTTFIGERDGKGILSRVEDCPDGLPRVFPEYSPYIVTGRVSLSGGLHQLPRGSGIKSFFIPSKKGRVILHADYSQVELRIAAHNAREENMLRAFREGQDLHKITAGRAFGVPPEEISDKDEKRQCGKSANFLMIFDGKEFRLQEQIKVATGLELPLEDCTALRNGFFEEFPEIRADLDRTYAELIRRRLVVAENGRVRRLPDVDYGSYVKGRWESRRWVGPKEIWKELLRVAESPECPTKVMHLPTAEQRAFALASLKFSHAKKQAANFKVQSVGATITKRAIMGVQRAGFQVILTTHDSLDIELEERQLGEVPRILRIMEGAYPLRCPLKVDHKLLRSLDESDKFVLPEAA
jgi:DNA polymerase-1